MIDKILDLTGLIFFLYVCVNEIRLSTARSKKKRELKQFDAFLVDVRHFYYQSGLALSSVREAQAALEGRLSGVISDIADSIESDSLYELDSLLRGSAVSKYLKVFALIVNNVEEYGDISGEKDKGFLASLLDIRMDISTELRLLTKKGHLFMGFAMTAAIPILLMPAVSAWACSTLAELTGFYYGKAGLVVRIFLVCITMLVYSQVVKLREGRDRQSRPSRAEVWLAGDTFAGRLIDKIIVKNYTRALKHTELLRSQGGRETVNILYLRQALYSLACIAFLILIYADPVLGGNMGIVDIVVCVLGPVAAFFLPLAGLYLKKHISSDSLQEEISDLLLASSLMSPAAGMNVLKLLDVLSMFAEQLRPAIERCANNYAIEGDAALELLQAEEDTEQFSRIVECLNMVDDVGVEEAFLEINDDRRQFREYRNQEKEYLLEDKSKLAMLLAILPGLLILFVYLLIPFMSKALELFDSYAGNLEDSFI